jgi:hypothetical protein
MVPSSLRLPPNGSCSPLEASRRRRLCCVVFGGGLIGPVLIHHRPALSSRLVRTRAVSEPKVVVARPPSSLTYPQCVPIPAQPLTPDAAVPRAKPTGPRPQVRRRR